MRRQIEILAPAGSYESMRAAMNAGCDAVYIGSSSFGARAYADNPDEEALLRAIDEAHLRGKKLYLTVNTLIKEKELTDQLYRFLEKFYLEGLDAVIVQDVGVMHYIHRCFPKLPIHASTQTTITMAQGADLLKNLGVTRLVTARELSLKEIKVIRENTDIEIETFVHGALCYCYSGQCLLSSMIGGRSGNRGRCAQPCRMPYQFFSEDKKLSSGSERYLLSPKDINTVAIIPELIEAGIDSFKIEGRMKRPEYSAGVSAVYRKYVDLFFDMGKEKYKEYLKSRDYEKDMNDLSDLYNRGGFSEGYGKLYHGKSMMSLTRPNHSGLIVGNVSDIKGSRVAITLKEDVNAQDILEIRNRDDETGYEFTVKEPAGKGNILRTNVGFPSGHADTGFNPSKKGKSSCQNHQIKPGAYVYRTKNNKLLNDLTSRYLKEDKKQGIRGNLHARAGERLSLTLYFKDLTVTAYQDIVQKAFKQPMSDEKLAAPVEKLGDTLFYFEELTIDSRNDIFVPVAWLNAVRRDAVQLLKEAVTGKYKRKSVEKDEKVPEAGADIPETEDGKVPEAGTDIHDSEDEKIPGTGMDIRKEGITVTGRNNNKAEYLYNPEQVYNAGQASRTGFGIISSVQTMEQFEASLLFKEVSSIYLDYDKFSTDELLRMADKISQAGKGCYFVLPHICRLAVYEKLKKEIVLLLNKNNISGFIFKNFEEFELLRSFSMGGKVQGPVLNSRLKIIPDHNMYIFNNEAKKFWQEKGLNRFTAPVELNFKELKALGIEGCDLIVYGHLPLMVSAQCLHESAGGCARLKAGQYRNEYLVDRLGMKFFVHTNCRSCYNTIYNGQCLSLIKQVKEVNILGPENIRLNFTVESAEEVKNTLSLFINAYFFGREVSAESSDLTTGHFRRGVE